MNKRSFWNTKKAMRLSLMLCLCYSLVGLYSCHNEDNGMYNKGKLKFQMETDTTLVNSSSDKSSRSNHFSDFEDPKTYKVVISQNSEVVAEFDSYEEMPEEIELEEGQYSIEASKGTETTAAFESPYFSGKQDFTIVKEKTTPVEVTASLQNSLVTVDYSSDFIETYKDYTLSFKTNKMQNPLIYDEMESRAMYFQADAAGTKLTIGMSLVNVYGKEVEYTASTTIKPKQWSKLTVRTDGNGLNGIALDVILNDGTKEPVYINIGIPDFMEQLKGAPRVECQAFNWSGNEIIEEAFDLGLKDTGSILTAPAVINVTAGGKIAEMKLKLTQDENTVIDYDLANLTEEQQTKLKDEFNLDIKSNEIKDKINYSFDIQPLLNSIKATDKESEYFITISVKDALPSPNTTVRYLKGKLNKVGIPSITTELQAQKFEEESYSSESYNVDFSVPGAIKTILLKIDGLDISQDITNGSSINGIEYQKGSNSISFKNVWFNTIKAGNYNVSIEIEDLFGQKLTENNSFAIKVNPPVFEWAMAANEGDVFAKYAFLRVKAKDASKVTFYHNGQVIDSNLDFLGKDEETGIVSFVWKGLTPNTRYDNIIAKYDDRFEISSISFTTEDDVQLPNNNFSSWEVYMKYVGGTLKKAYTPFYKAEYWNTNNDQTAISLNGLGGSIPSINTSYRSFPAVIFNGLQANIMSIGYGGLSSDLSSEYASAGMMWLFDGQEGIEMFSRPQSIKIVYQMNIKEENNGKIEIAILDTNNEHIVSTNKELTSNSSFEELNIKLEYDQYIKSSRIMIKFYSSTSNSPSLEATSVTVPTPDGNQSYGVRAGNVLTIQKVELIYDYE